MTTKDAKVLKGTLKAIHKERQQATIEARKTKIEKAKMDREFEDTGLKRAIITKSPRQPRTVEKPKKVEKKEAKPKEPEVNHEKETLKDTLADALNAEQEAKKAAEDLKLELKQTKEEYKKELANLKKSIESLKSPPNEGE